MTVTYAWRGSFTNDEVNALLHAEALSTQAFSSQERDWLSYTERWSLGWVLARGNEVLVGFLNVLGDGLVHAWLQDVMVLAASRRSGIGAGLVAQARAGCVVAGYEWLHLDFTDELRPFYLNCCGFTSTSAGLMHLS